MLWRGSAIRIDPERELASVTACRRSDAEATKWTEPVGGGGKVHAADPFHRVTGPPAEFRAAFNALAGQLADALVSRQEGVAAHWPLSARAFLRGLLLTAPEDFGVPRPEIPDVFLRPFNPSGKP